MELSKKAFRPLLHLTAPNRPSLKKGEKKSLYYSLTPTVVKEFVNFSDKEATSLHIAVVNLKEGKKKDIWGFLVKENNWIVNAIIDTNTAFPLKEGHTSLKMLCRNFPQYSSMTRSHS